MSLLGTPVYANNATPLWLSTQGDIMTGDMTFKTPASISWEDNLGNSLGRIVGAVTGPYPPPPNPPPSSLYIQTNDAISFSQIGQSAANTSLFIDAYGGEDLFKVGGQIQTTSLGLDELQSIGQSKIDAGTTSTAITFTTARIAPAYIFTQLVGAPVAGPALGPAQGQLTITNISPTGFTVNIVNTDGVTYAPAVDVPFVWMAMDPV